MNKRYKTNFSIYLNTLMRQVSLIGIILLGVTAQAMAQSRIIKGQVLDSNDESGVPGVNILKAVGGGTITDIDGNFSIEGDDQTVLTFSYIGYLAQEVKVGTREVLKIIIEPDIQQLSEVVVIGYGSVEKKDVTGVVASVDAKQFNRGIVGSPDKLLTGKVAGLQITTSGEPGAKSSIKLRGLSISGQAPLFVIDGVPMDKDDGVLGGRNPLNFINPNDVENITVLKDASASAIYGSRGANGVIIITTKSGQSGKMKVAYDGFYSISQFAQEVDNYEADLYRAVIYDKAPDRIGNLGDHSTNWVDEVTQVAHGQQHNLSMSGGSKSTTYFISGNYLKNKGILRKTENETTSLSVKLTQNMFDNQLAIKVNSKNGWTTNEFSPDVMGAALSMDPTQPVFDTDPDNIYGGYFQWNKDQTTVNPVSDQDLNQRKGSTIRSLSNIELSYQPNFIEGLSLNVNLAYNYTKGEYYARADSLLKSRVINASGIGINDEYESKETILSDYYVNYKKSIDALDTKIDLTGGYSYQNFTHSGKNKLVGDNVLYENGVIVGMDTLPTQIEPLEKRMISFFGRAIFDFKGKYLLTTSLRRDGSSKFSPAKQWGLFPSLAVAWRMSDEPWIQSLGIFSDLKLRAGYGVTGNEEIAPYLYNTFYKFGESDAAYQFGNEFVRTLRPKSVDPTIQWEETISTNIGFDAGLFEGRLNVSAEYYVKIVDKLLYNVAQPVGLNPGDKVTKNIGQVNNKGIELTIDGVIMDRKDLQWNLNFNVAKNTDKLSRIDTNSDPNFGGYSVSGISGNTGETIQVLKADERVYAFRTYQQRYDANGFPVYDVSDLTNMYVDQLTVDTDGDGVADAADGIINEFDQVVGPSPNPDWILGLTSNLSYKGFDLAMTWRANLGQTVYNNVASSQGYFDNLTNDVSQNNIHQSAYATGFKTIQLHSDYYLENGSFVKLDNITLGYTFDQLKFATMKAYCTVQNIATITKYSGVDPEVTNITDSIEGVDNNLYPRARTFILGLRANF